MSSSTIIVAPVAVTASSWSTTPDILQSIFTFLELRPDLASNCIHVSHSWYTAAHRIPSQCVTWPFRSSKLGWHVDPFGRMTPTFQAAVDQLMTTRSPFVYHVTRILINGYFRISHFHKFMTIFTAATSDVQNHLEEMRLNISINEFEEDDSNWREMLCFTLPHSLLRLDFELSVNASTTENMKEMISIPLLLLSHELRERNTLLQSFILHVEFASHEAQDDERYGNYLPRYEEDRRQELAVSACSPSIKFLDNLRQLPYLREFEYHAEVPVSEFTLEQLTVIRSFPVLTRFRCAIDKAVGPLRLCEVLEALLPNENDDDKSRHPQLHLEILPFSEPQMLSPEFSNMIKRYHWLRVLELTLTWPPHDLTFLTHLTQLQHFSLKNDRVLEPNPIDIEMQLIIQLELMSYLTRLELTRFLFSPDQLCSLLRRLPRTLTQLTVSAYCKQINTNLTPNLPLDFELTFDPPPSSTKSTTLTLLKSPSSSSSSSISGVLVSQPMPTSSSSSSSSSSYPSSLSYLLRVFSRERTSIDMITQLQRSFNVSIIHGK